jgi:class 3 adenylate cyclase
VGLNLARLKGSDALLLLLVPVWLFVVGMGAWGRSVADIRYVPAEIGSARSPGGHPVVRDPWGSEGLEPGDRLLRVGELDTRGLTAMPYAIQAATEAGRAGPDGVGVVLERDGARKTLVVPTRDAPPWWMYLPFTASLMGCAVLLLLQAPTWHLRRPFFVAAFLWALLFSIVVTSFRRFDLVMGFVGVFLRPATLGLTLWTALEFTKPRRLATHHWLAVLALPAVVFSADLVSGWLRVPFSGALPAAAFDLAWLVFAALIIATTTLQYRGADAVTRRRLRWALLGAYVAFVPMAIFMILSIGPVPVPADVFVAVRTVAHVLIAAVPVGFLVSIVWFDFQDVDRLITTTVTFSILLVGLALAGLLGIPSLAEQVGSLMGTDPGGTSVALSFGLVALLVPAHRALRPQVDRALFRGHHEVERQVGELIEALSSCDGLEALAGCAGARLDAAFEPESVTLHAWQGEGFMRAFPADGSPAPDFAAASPLVATLTARRSVLVVSRPEEARALAPFDRAALETLGAAAVLPIHRGESLAAFLCLGAKRSGDIYTPTDAALLMAVGASFSQQLGRLEGEARLAESRNIQDNLRRYVPGALADALGQGREIASGEREVSVVFVDIRGYSGLAEQQELAEVHSLLSRYSDLVSTIVARHGGEVVEFGGDGLMVVFGAVDETAGDAVEKERAAVAAGLAICESVPTLSLAGERLSVGVGIATGQAFVGEIHSASRRFWSAIGTTTNLAARLQALSRGLEAKVVVDEPTYARSGGLCNGFAEHREVEIRGHRMARTVYALPLGASGEAGS